MRMQAAQIMVSPIAGTLESTQVELTGQRGSSSHTVLLRGKKGSHRVGVRPCEVLISSPSALLERADGLGGFPAFPGVQLSQSFISLLQIKGRNGTKSSFATITWFTYLSLQLWEQCQDNRQRGFSKGGFEGLIVAAPLSLWLLPPLLKPFIGGGHQHYHCGSAWGCRAGVTAASSFPPHPSPLGLQAPPGNRSSQVGSLAEEEAMKRKGMCAEAFSLGIDR